MKFLRDNISRTKPEWPIGKRFYINHSEDVKPTKDASKLNPVDHEALHMHIFVLIFHGNRGYF